VWSRKKDDYIGRIAMMERREERRGWVAAGWGWREADSGYGGERERSRSCVGLFRLISYERIDHTWVFPLHVYLYKNYNPNRKWKITILRTLHDLEDQGVMSHNVIYLWQSCHIM
jgi:hypothetical protein